MKQEIQRANRAETGGGAWRRAVLAGVCLAALSGGAAHADDAQDAKIRALEEQIAELAEQIQDLKASTANQVQDVRRVQEATTVSVANARPTFATGDGQFSVSLRGVVHFDAASYDQAKPGPLATDFRRGSFGDATEATRARDLNDGTNFRRARLGVEGKAFTDFDYSLIYEFGGSGAEEGGRVQDLWVQYSGLKPFRFRVGAFAPPTGLEDGGSTNGSLFLERPSSAEVVRAIAGGDGRSGAAIYANGERWFASAAWTGATVGTQSFDEQSAIVARAAFVPFKGYDWLIHAGAHTTQVLRPADAGPDTASNRYALRLRDRPELRVDGTRLVDTGNIDAEGLNATGVELAGQWRNFYIASEYDRISIARRNSLLPDPEFSGWYVQGSWILTGEARRYQIASAGFDGPKPDKPFKPSAGQWGAFELTGRYSTLDLNYREGEKGFASPFGAVRGGEQDIWTVGLNWYLNPVFRFVVQYQDVSVDRLSPGASAFGAGALTPAAGKQVGQDYHTVAVRTQIAF